MAVQLVRIYEDDLSPRGSVHNFYSKGRAKSLEYEVRLLDRRHFKTSVKAFF